MGERQHEMRNAADVVEEKQRRVLREWREQTPVYLASSSLQRKKGLVSVGFVEENIRAIPAPDEREIFALEKYLTEYEPHWSDARRSNAMAHIAADKVKYLEEHGVPDDALWFAFDTMPVHYMANPEWGKPEFDGSIWLGVADKKPTSLEEAKTMTKETFLLLMRNYLRYKDRSTRGKKLETFGQFETKNERLDVVEQPMDFASAIHVKTAMAAHFPHKKEVSIFTDRLILRPLWLYELAELAGVKETPSNIHDDMPDRLRSIVVKPGSTIDSLLDDVVQKIFDTMHEEGVNPRSISGGVAYHVARVRDLLGIEEFSRSGSNKEEDIDRTIYTGFPKKLFEEQLALAALAQKT